MLISDKIVKIDSDIRITIADNGYIFEVSGKNVNDDWRNVKIVCNTRSELDSLLDETLDLERTD
jgi:hypothetical protein